MTKVDTIQAKMDMEVVEVEPTPAELFANAAALAALRAKRFDPRQRRDRHGRWTDTGSGGPAAANPLGTALFTAISTTLRDLAKRADQVSHEDATREVQRRVGAKLADIPPGQSIKFNVETARSATAAIKIRRTGTDELGRPAVEMTAIPRDGGPPEPTGKMAVSNAAVVLANSAATDHWLHVDAPKPTGRPVNVENALRPDAATRPLVERAEAAIDKVHAVPADMRPVPITSGSMKNDQGAPKGDDVRVLAEFEHDVFDDTPTRLGVNSQYAAGDASPWMLTHELGHYLDFELFGDTPGVPASTDGIQGKGELAPIFKAIQGTPEMQELLHIAKDKKRYVHGALGRAVEKDLTPDDQHTIDYLLTPTEILARAYANYIAVRGHDPNMEEAVRREYVGAATYGMPDQWTPTDFEPVAKAFDKLFADKGLAR